MWKGGAWGRIRTTDTRIFNPLLYQLSYPGPCILHRAPVGRRKEVRLYGRRKGLSRRSHASSSPAVPG